MALSYPSTNCTANVARRSKYAFSVGGATSLTKRVALKRWGIKAKPEFATDDSQNGTLWTREENYVKGRIPVGGAISLVPRADDLAWMLPLLIGKPAGGNTGGTFKPGPLCEFFRVARLDTAVDKLYSHKNCATSTCSFSSSDSQNGLLSLDWSIEATEDSPESSAGFPGSAALSALPPFVHRQSSLVIDSDDWRLKDVKIDINNMLMTDEFYNSLYRFDIPQDGQMITLSHTSPFDGALSDGYLGVDTPVEATLVYTSGGTSLSFYFPCLKALPQAPDVAERGRLLHQIQWQACLPPGADLATDVPLEITLDYTP